MKFNDAGDRITKVDEMMDSAYMNDFSGQADCPSASSRRDGVVDVEV